jgi:hypothetical protein
MHQQDTNTAMVQSPPVPVTRHPTPPGAAPPARTLCRAHTTHTCRAAWLTPRTLGGTASRDAGRAERCMHPSCGCVGVGRGTVYTSSSNCSALSSLLSSYSDPALRTPTPPCTVPTQRQRERGTDPPIAVGARRGTGEDAGEGARLRQPRRAAWGFLKPLLRCGWCALSGRLYTTRW